MDYLTERLHIRPFKSGDISDTFFIYNQRSTCRYLLHDVWTKQNMYEQFNNKRKNHMLTKESALSLAVLKDSRVIGDLSVWYTAMKDTVEIGYSFSSSVAGNGYASEAVKSLIIKLFDEFGVHRIQATLDARNESSKKLCQRVGMRKEAHFIQDYWNKGEWTDSIVFGMLKSDVGSRRD